MKFLRNLLLILCVSLSIPLLHAQDEDLSSWLDDSAQEFTVDDPSAENVTQADVVANQPKSDDDFDAMMKSWDEPVPGAVAEPAPVATSENIPMPIEIPVIGTLNLYPYTDPVTQKKGFRVKFPSSGRIVNFGPLALDSGAFTFADNKLNYGATATLFGKGVRVVTREISQAETTTKGIEVKGKGKQKVEGKKYTKVRLGIEFLPGQQITFEIIPGARFTVVAADVVLAKNQPIQFIIRTTIGGKFIEFGFILRKDTTDAVAQIPPMPLKVLIPDVQGTPVEDVEIEDMSLTIKNFMTKKKDEKGQPIKPKQRIIKLHGKLDFSGVKGLEESSEAKTMELTGTYNAKKGTYLLKASAKDISLPTIGVIKNAKLIIDFTRKKKKDPLKKSVKLQGDMSFDAGFGTFEILVDALITQKGLEFSGQIKQEVSFNGITLKNPQVSYSTEKRSIAISGEADVFGYHTKMTIAKDKTGKYAAEASMGDTSLRPFAKLPFSFLQNLEIKNPKLSVQQLGKIKSVAMKGTVTLFGKETGIVLYTTTEPGQKPEMVGVIDIPGSIEVADIAALLCMGTGACPLQTMFGTVSSLVSIKLNKAKLIVATQPTRDLPDVGTVAAGFGVKGNVDVGGAVGGLLSTFGLRGGVNADIFLPFNMNDMDKVRISIAKDVNESIASDLIKVDSLGFIMQGAKPPKFPELGIKLAAEIAGSKLDLTGSFQPTGAIDVEGSLKGDISLEKFKFPIRIQNPFIELHMLAGEPTGMALAGIFKFGDATGDIYADIDLKDPMSSIIQFSKLNICITDTYNLWLAMAQTTAHTGTSLQLPKILCLKDVTGQWAMKFPYATKKHCEKDCNVLPGIALKGTLDFGVPAIPHGKVDMQISPYHPMRISAQGSLGGEIDLGGVIKITGADGKGNPSLGIEVSEDKQEAWIDGFVDLTLVKQSTKMRLSSSGFQLLGNMTITVPKIGSGVLDVVIDTEKLLATGVGKLDKKIDFGGVIKITDASGDHPPSIGLSVSKSEQKVWIDGKVNLAGVFQDQTKVYLTSAGAEFDLLTTYLGVDATIDGRLPFGDPAAGVMEFKLSMERVNTFVKEDLGKYLNIAKDEISKYIGKAEDAIDDAGKGCGSVEVLSDLCRSPLQIAKGTLILLKETVKQSMTGIDKLSSEVVKQLELDFVSIKGNLSAFKGSGNPVSLTFKFKIFGKTVGPITLSMPSPNDIGGIAQKVAEYIYDHELKSAVNALKDQTEKIYHEITGFLNSAANAIQGAFEDIAGAATKVAAIAVQFGNTIKDATLTVGNTFKNVGEQTGGAIKNFSVDAAGKIANTAVTVGNSVADITKNMGNQAVDFANMTGNFTQDAADKVKDAFTTAGNSIKNTFEDIGRKLKFW